MKSGASAELFSVGRASSLAGLFGESSCRLPLLYCNRERCRNVGESCLAAANF